MARKSRFVDVSTIEAIEKVVWKTAFYLRLKRDKISE